MLFNNYEHITNCLWCFLIIEPVEVHLLDVAILAISALNSIFWAPYLNNLSFLPFLDMVDPSRHLLKMRAAALVVSMACWLFALFRRRLLTPPVTYGPMLTRDIERQANLRFIYQSNDLQCVELLRMSRAPFFKLCDLFRSRHMLRDSIHSSVEEQVAMFLHIVGHNQRFRVIKLTFRRSMETVSRYFQEVIAANRRTSWWNDYPSIFSCPSQKFW